MKLDIACGRNKQKGYLGVDSVPGEGVDFVVNLEQYPWAPFKDGVASEIHISHYLEQVKDFTGFMDEIWRICQNGATVKVLSAYYTSIRAQQDPRNMRGISEGTFLFLDKEWRKQNGVNYPTQCDFKVDKILTFMNEPWNNKSDETKQFAQRHYWNVVSDIYVELKAIK